MKHFALVALLAWPAGAAAQVCSPTAFIEPGSFPLGANPSGVALGDFDNDQDLDAVFTSQGDSDVRVLLGDGAGGFSAPVVTAAQSGYRGIVAGFFDADANLDVAAVEFSSVAVLFGRGDGTFDSPVNLPTPAGQMFLIAGDFDGDGAPDLASLGDGGFEVSVLMNVGNGTFQPAITFPVALDSVGLAAGDFDGDGPADLVLSSGSGVVSVYPSLGDGTFGPPAVVKIGGFLFDVEVADFNDDAKLDFAVVATPYVAIAHGNGDGTFRAAVEHLVGETTDLTVGDFDGDGLADLAALKPTHSSVSASEATILLQRDGELRLGSRWGAGPGTIRFVAGDFDGDGLDDLLDSAFYEASVSLLMAEGGGRFRGNAVVQLPGQPWDLAAGDFDVDGKTDVAALQASGDPRIAVLTRGPDGLFEILAASESLPNSLGIAVADFDHDGRLDAAVASYDRGVGVLLGNGDGSFRAPVSYQLPRPAFDIATGDFNGDHHPDIAVVNGDGIGQEVAVFLGRGDGAFDPGPGSPLIDFPASMVAADLNLDEKLDIVTVPGCCGGPDAIVVLLGNGDGSFQPGVEHATGPRPSSVAVANLSTADSFPDLIVANSGDQSISVLINAWNGGFEPFQLVPLGWTPTAVATGYFDASPFADVVTINLAGNMSLLSGLGDGAFQPPVDHPVGTMPRSIVVGDFNGGLQDVAVGSDQDFSVSIVRDARLFAALLKPVPTVIGTAASLTAFAAGYGPLQYQWRKEGVPIPEGGRYSGTTTATLTIADVSYSDMHFYYDALVNDSCTTVESYLGLLDVEFADVPVSNPFHDHIDTVARYDIAAGCGGANYCPDAFVTRAQMAALVLKGEHGGDYTPPACTGVFADVPCPGLFADWIEQLVEEGITAGCGGGNYCPDALVTRAQTAVFLLKAREGSGFVPSAATGIFGDVPVGSFAADWIETLYEYGITRGCSSSPLLYCPASQVTRAQMAAFIVNAFFFGSPAAPVPSSGVRPTASRLPAAPPPAAGAAAASR